MRKAAKAVPFGLSFDDVLLVPNLTALRSRKDAVVSTRLTPQISLQIPIVSANVPWCTESRMAAAMAMLGGIGIVHRMTTPALQAREIRIVKAIEFAPSDYPNATVDKDGRLMVGAAVGVKGDYLARARAVTESGADLLLVDIAHGHSQEALEAIAAIRRVYPKIALVAGNVATAKGTAALIRMGVDAVKVGIGPGGICTTRLVTGCGVPQVTAILGCSEYAAKRNIPIIADGGIRAAGDITKALAAGASTVMLGSMLAGAEESAALTVVKGARRYKITTGFVTLGMELTLKRASKVPFTEKEIVDYVPEGVESSFPFTGPLRETIGQCLGGLKSGMSYCGAKSIPQLWKNAQFIQISPAGFLEGTPHALKRSDQVHPDYKRQYLAQAAQGAVR
jgi:IMP dehydrogenase/GMP reductase